MRCYDVIRAERPHSIRTLTAATLPYRGAMIASTCSRAAWGLHTVAASSMDAAALSTTVCTPCPGFDRLMRFEVLPDFGLETLFRAFIGFKLHRFHFSQVMAMVICALAPPGLRRATDWGRFQKNVAGSSV